MANHPVPDSDWQGGSSDFGYLHQGTGGRKVDVAGNITQRMDKSNDEEWDDFDMDAEIDPMTPASVAEDGPDAGFNDMEDR